MNEPRFPLHWPLGWPRTKYRHLGPFRGATVASATTDLGRELRLLGASDEILSTNVTLRLDGLPRSNQGPPPDPGVAVYFTLKKKRLVLACDRWSFVEHNLRAIAKHIEALRGQERWGVGSIERAFTGYAALPPATNGYRGWREELGFDPEDVVTADDIETFFRAAIKGAHPDVPGGSEEGAKALIRARDEGLFAIGAAS